MAQKNSKSITEILEPFLIVAIFAVILYVGYTTLFQQQFEQLLPGGSLHVETVKQQLSDRKDYLAALTKLDDLYQSSTKDVSKELSELLPSDQGVPQIFASYEAIGNKFGVSIQSIDIVSDKAVAPKQNSGVQSLLVSMKVANASYDSVKQFLDAVENNVRIADVQSISFDPRSRFIDISLRSYYRASPTTKK